MGERGGSGLNKQQDTRGTHLGARAVESVPHEIPESAAGPALQQVLEATGMRMLAFACHRSCTRTRQRTDSRSAHSCQGPARTTNGKEGLLQGEEEGHGVALLEPDSAHD